MRVVVDAFGGDYAPVEIIEGALIALKKHKDLTITLCGDEIKIKEILNGRIERISISHAPDVILNSDSPTTAIRTKKDSSLVRCFDLLKHDDETVALISAGSTGAILSGVIMKTGRIKGISRPTLAPILPTGTDRSVILVDSGANVDCKPVNLLHFALMGSAYYKIMTGESNPRVGLLNIGTEDHKGNDLIKETYPLMKELPINFIGSVEAREIMSGDIDVMVADGFAGNVLLKTLEGTAGTIVKTLKKSIKSNIFSMFGALFMKKTFKELKMKLDAHRYGGSPFLGAKKLVMKCHGTAKRDTVVATIEQTIRLHENKLIENISNMLSQTTLQEDENE